MDTSILEEMGLSKGEAAVYLALLRLGETKVGGIIEKSGMASSAVHNSINTLIEKGLVAYIKKGKIKFYQAVPPKQILDFIEDKKKDFLKILPELELQQKKAQEIQDAEIFEGTKGIISMLNLLIENTKKGDEYLFFSVNVKEMNEEIQEFFQMYDAKRKAKGLNVKGLAPKDLKKLFIKRKILKMNYVDFPIPSNISICNDKVAFFSWEEKPVGYLIKSKQIAEMYKKYFKDIWNQKNF
jgi:sugar-specific transcriptional regulator TrmB